MLFANLTKKVGLVFGITLFVVSVYLSQYTFAHASSSAKETSPVLGVFVGTTPCDSKNPPVPQISADTPCEMMIWNVVLNQEPETGKPTTYTLTAAYGMTQPNTTGVAGGGIKLDREGKWTILDGTKDNPDAVIYQLNPDTPDSAISFIKISDHLIHVLTPEHTMMIGNGGWSYTLSRTDPIPTVDPTAADTDLTLEPVELPVVPESSATVGVFEGRTPCADIVYQFHNITRNPACTKIKWQLTLKRDTTTGQPTTYTLKSVHVKDEPTIAGIEGTWTAVRAAKVHPDAVIYRLSYEASDHPLFFLKADDNHLFMLDQNLNLMVGDKLWSYTLSNVGE